LCSTRERWRCPQTHKACGLWWLPWPVASEGKHTADSIGQTADAANL
jgi:hypothetical protein